jgi:thiol-disulfide isomerase/thioredoxin
MWHARNLISWSVLFGLFSTFVLAADVPATLPRYSLPVGRRLSYVGESHFVYTNGSFDSLSTTQITVVAKNSDGSLRIIVRNGEREVQNRAGQPATQPANETEDVNYTQFDIMPDGRVISAEGGFHPEAPGLLSPLPADQNEMGAQWKREPTIPGDTDVFISEGATDGIWTFTSTSEGLFKTIYGMTTRFTYHFDLAKGIINSVDSQNGQDYGFHGKGSGTSRLQGDEMIPADQIAQLAKDVATLISTTTDFNKKIDGIDASTSDVKPIVDQAKAILLAAQANVATTDIKNQFDQTIASIDRRAKYAMENAQHMAAVTNHPAFDFIATDLGGKSHKLSDYRGKVVVLDFWYRGCGWCIRAMPQMKQVAEDFHNKPVVLLGLNTDSNIDDAKFVVDAMGLNYATLRIDHDVPDKFGVHAFPSLLIIDIGGVVREFDEGYSPTLRKDLGAKIQSILDGGVAAAQAR